MNEVLKMENLGKLFQTGDWKKEKHVPAIDFRNPIKKDEPVNVNVGVGKEIAHPNTTEHHIEWIEVYFLPEGEKFLYAIGKFEFSAHGASIDGPNKSSIYSQPEVICTLKTAKSGTLLAASYCNIHGLWTSSEGLKIEG